MARQRRSLRKNAVTAGLAVLDLVVRPTGGVVLHSQPDLDDSVVSLLRAAPPDIPVTVLVDEPDRARARSRALGLDVPLVRRSSRAGLRAYLRATVTVCTHGLYGSRRRARGRQVLGLWHGEFGKLVGHFAGEPRRHFDWMPVSSQLSQTHRCGEFGLDRARVHVVGSPRQQLLLDAAAAKESGTDPSVVWAPTFRSTSTGRARVDGDPDRLDRELRPDDPELTALLRRHGATLWYRAHPAETRTGPPDDELVRLAGDADLEVLGLTFYELLARATVFVTDYSSLWVDHLLCDRPMISFCPDLETYRTNRGLALEPHEEWFPGPLARSRDELLAALDDVLSDHDAHAGARATARRLLHTAPDARPSDAVWQHVAGVLDGSAAP